MKFRPLCIDYHSRAQEIVAVEREVLARRMALRLLPPNPSSTPCDLRRGRSRSGDGIGPSGGRGDAPPLDSGDETNIDSVPRADHGRIDDVDGETNGKVVESLDEEHVDSSGQKRWASSFSNANANDRDTSRERILLCTDMLGAAVHPSDCTLRSIAPVTKGPVRGTTIPIARELPKLFEESAKLYTVLVDTKLDAVTASLDTGRSRFDSIRGRVLGPSSDASMRNGLHDTPHHRATFAETMKVVYGRHGGFRDDDDPCLDLDGENALNSQIWTQHVNDMPIPNSIYLRHEPDDLAKIYSDKFLRSSAKSSFASDIKRSFSPRLRTSTRDGHGTIVARAKNLGEISAKPSFDTNMNGISQSSKKCDCHLSSDSVPFATFLDVGHDDGSIGQINASVPIAGTYNYTEKDLIDSKGRYTIMLDPDFDPERPIHPENERTDHERMRSLNEICSATSILALFQRPSRFEESHELSIRQPKDTRHLGIFSTPLKIYKELDHMDDTLDSLLLVYETRAAMSSLKFRPRKIRLDADISTPVLFGANIETPILFGNGDNLLKDSTHKSFSASSLRLPSFYETFTSARKLMIIAGSRSGGVNQKHFIASFSSVSKMVPLKNLVNSSRITSLFLPQSTVEVSIEARARSSRPKSSPREGPTPTAIASSIRSHVQYGSKNIEQGDIKFLQEQCATYPVAPWFGCNSAGNLASTKSELDEKILKMKRKTFCDNAISKSHDEGIRCLLSTGCSSKRNVDYKYSYRGFLTNQVVDPEVFKRRYIAMVQVDKFHKRRRNQNTLEGRLSSPAHEAIFTPLALRVYAESFSRHKTLKSNGRGAPYSAKLTTSRHGQGQNTVSMTNENNSNKGATEFLIDLGRIEELATCLNNRLAQEAETKYGDSDGGRAVEAHGKSSLKTRGELLHLLTKARELEDEKKSYLADLAVANRSFVGTGNTEADVGVDTLYSSPHVMGTIDLTVPDGYHRVEKRKSESDPSFDEQNEKRSKKEKKKDKKKKEKKKRKKHRKRKHRDDAPDDESKKLKALETVSREEQSQISSSTLNNTRIRVLVPSIPLGDMTPIIPSRQLESCKKMGTIEQSESQNERLARLETEDLPYNPAEFETSPDSVATLNSNSFRGSEMEAHFYGVGQFSNFEHTSNSIDEGINVSSRHEGVDQGELNENESAFTIDSIDSPSQVRSPRNLLTSENFLEASGHIVAELASGRWRNALSMSENSGFDDSTQEIAVIDCPLLDVAGVDIELSDDSAIIVQCLSSWSGNDQNGNTGGNVPSVQRGARAFIRRLVFLAASGRYNAIHVILCLDVEMSTVLSGDIVTLQNAVIQQVGSPVETVSFEYVGPRALSASIAMRLMSAPTEIGGLHFISDQSVQERARFLITLVPTMTVHMALRCCLENSSGTNSLSDIFEVARRTSRDMFPYKMDGILSKCASDQLWSAVNMDISHAY